MTAMSFLNKNIHINIIVVLIFSYKTRVFHIGLIKTSVDPDNECFVKRNILPIPIKHGERENNILSKMFITQNDARKCSFVFV